MTNQSYEKYSKKKAKKSPLFKNICFAFFVGGLICMLGQALLNLYISLGLEKERASSLLSITLVFLACLFTGLGLFDRLAKYAGAGTLVPITGFANAMCSPSIDNKAEGYVLGVGAKMFVIAGPVIVYGTLTSIALGIIMYVLSLFGIDISHLIV